MSDALRPDSTLVHAGAEHDAETGAVSPPIHFATTFARDASYALPGPYLYGRYANPTRDRLEAALTALESGADAAAFASGLAAATCALQATLAPGAHLVVTDGVYGGIRSLLAALFVPWGVRVTYVNQSDLAAVEAALAAAPTALVWLESPSNPLWQLADIAAVSALAARYGARTLVDNTVATPLGQSPLALGADVVLHSTTKYLSGHSDVTGGALVTRAPGPWWDKVRELQKLAGAVPSPFDCWLLLRGIRTLGVRLERQSASALAIAQWLEAQPSIRRVHYPGLPSHPQHALAARQMRLTSGMFSAEVSGDAAAAIALTTRLRVFARATSLGGVESMVEHRKSVEPPETPTPESLLRFSVGLEDVRDLLDDLRSALAV